MTPEQLKQKYPLAYKELHKYACFNELLIYTGRTDKIQTDTCFAYLDSVGVWVGIEPFIVHYQVSISYIENGNERYERMEDNEGYATRFLDRPTATQAGIKKGMEIREEQLK